MKLFNKRKIHLFLIIIGLCSVTDILAQINGQVQDEIGQSLSFSNILLLNFSDSSLVKGTITNESGAFELQDIKQGKYLIKVTSIGYRSFFTGPLDIKTDQQTTNLTPIILKENLYELEEVVVEEERPLYEQKIDRIVVNVENSIASAGNTALEILQKSPGIQVNRRNNTISLNGKGGVQVMINNKLTPLPIDAVVQMLDGMNGSNIKKIELITTPPAKYDAEGTGGIIHIVLKENEFQGTSGSYGLNTGYNSGETLGGNFNLFHRSKKFGYLLDYSINYDHADQVFDGFRSTDNEGFNWTIDNISQRDSKTTVQNIRAGMEYFLSNNTTVDLLVTGYHRNWKLDAETRSESNVQIDSSIVTNMNVWESNIWQGATFNAGIDHRFNKKQSISFDFDYIYYENKNPSDYQITTDYIQSQLSEESEVDVDKFTPLSIKVAKLDYINQVSEILKVEAGLKGTSSHFKNNVYVANFIQDQWETVDSLTDKADLDEEIFAAYVSSSLNFTDNISLNAGLRYEYTNTWLNTEEKKGVVDRQLNNFFPTVYFQQKFNPKNSLQLSYSRRITRPTFNDMAPFVFLVDPYNFFSGNPALRPALVDVYTAGINLSSIIFSFQYSDSKFEISPFQPSFNPNTNQQILFSQNMEYLKTWNITTGIPFNPFEWWSVQTNIIGTYQRLLPVSEAEVIDLSVFSANLNNTFTLPKDFSLELSGFYRSKSLFGLWVFKPLGAVNLGIQKKFANGNNTLRLSFNDIFNTNVWRFSAVGRDDLLKADFSVQSINLSFTSGFGNSKLKKLDIKGGSEAEQRRVNQ